jgi:hypothetical protein
MQGWGSHHYPAEAITTPGTAIIVEIGVWKGASVIHWRCAERSAGNSEIQHAQSLLHTDGKR